MAERGARKASSFLVAEIVWGERKVSTSLMILYLLFEVRRTILCEESHFQNVEHNTNFYKI